MNVIFNVFLRILPAITVGLVILHGSRLDLSAQEPTSIGSESLGVDSVLLRYDFKPGQAVTYRVTSLDSVLIFSRTKYKIVRERVEMVRFRCDSLVPEGYAMTVTTTGYAATEYMDSLPPVVRDSHPWVDRAISFVMTPSGRRLRLLPTADTPTAGVAPGAPFQPLLLPDLGYERTFIGASGAFPSRQLMVDNAFPPVEQGGTSFRVVSARVDTAGMTAIRFSLSDVHRVEYTLTAGTGKNKGMVNTTTMINGGGEFYFVPALGYIASGQYQLIGNITLKTTDNNEATGRHILSMIYEIAREEQ